MKDKRERTVWVTYKYSLKGACTWKLPKCVQSLLNTVLFYKKLTKAVNQKHKNEIRVMVV